MRWVDLETNLVHWSCAQAGVATSRESLAGAGGAQVPLRRMNDVLKTALMALGEVMVRQPRDRDSPTRRFDSANTIYVFGRTSRALTIQAEGNRRVAPISVRLLLE
jgi:hypothetical protein